MSSVRIIKLMFEFLLLRVIFLRMIEELTKLIHQVSEFL